VLAEAWQTRSSWGRPTRERQEHGAHPGRDHDHLALGPDQPEVLEPEEAVVPAIEIGVRGQPGRLTGVSGEDVEGRDR
jgi:hypothetical protein